MYCKTNLVSRKKHDGFIAWKLYEDGLYHTAGTVVRDYILPSLSLLRLQLAFAAAFEHDGITIVSRLDTDKSLYLYFRVRSTVPPFSFFRLVSKFKKVLRRMGIIMNPMGCGISSLPAR